MLSEHHWFQLIGFTHQICSKLTLVTHPVGFLDILQPVDDFTLDDEIDPDAVRYSFFDREFLKTQMRVKSKINRRNRRKLAQGPILNYFCRKSIKIWKYCALFAHHMIMALTCCLRLVRSPVKSNSMSGRPSTQRANFFTKTFLSSFGSVVIW